MGKKKFFDKKKSATFQLLARDSSDPNYDGTAATDRVFVRVDNHSYTLPVFDDGPVDASGSASFEENPNSIFADAPDDYDDEENGGFGASGRSRGELGGPASLPENVRREILELGFPDDGYNYLLHLRDIKNTGGGSAFYNNPKAKLNQLPRDEKAYDASGVIVSQGTSDADENIMYKVASKTVGVKSFIGLAGDEVPEAIGQYDDIEDEYIFEESSDESEVWDCETIVSTCSNLNNHPGKIVAPEITRRKKLAETVSGALNSKNSMITLKGKEKLPVDFLPHGRKVVDKVKDNGSLKTEQQKRKLHGQESKEEKKERKAAVKEARREARRTKKELKELYKGETHRAQKVVAVSGPASIHLM
ncbi:Protein LTV1-like protein, partial [Cucurbita argyrosperma subsp. sororia]